MREAVSCLLNRERDWYTNQSETTQGKHQLRVKEDITWKLKKKLRQHLSR